MSDPMPSSPTPSGNSSNDRTASNPYLAAFDPTSSDNFDKAASAAAWRSDPRLSEKWKFRFDFFEKYGVPNYFVGDVPPGYREALKALPLGQRRKISVNFYAFFFTFIYYGFFLKLWRQALIILGVVLIVKIIFVLLHNSSSAATAIDFVVWLYCGMRANGLYYLKRTQGSIGWKI
jgi:hypothetical protein